MQTKEKTDYEKLKPVVDDLVKTIEEGLDAFAVIGDSKTLLEFSTMVKNFWKNHRKSRKGEIKN